MLGRRGDGFENLRVFCLQLANDVHEMISHCPTHRRRGIFIQGVESTLFRLLIAPSRRYGGG
jgi:hypothetical protein